LATTWRDTIGQRVIRCNDVAYRANLGNERQIQMRQQTRTKKSVFLRNGARRARGVA
jgi:hypothetical protein